MYVYLKTEPSLWTVGFHRPDGVWEPESDYNSPDAAADRVHYLNGAELPNQGTEMKEAPSAKKDKFGFLTGTLKVRDGQLVDRESGKRRRLGPGLEGRDVVVVDQEYLNDLVSRGQGAGIG